MRWIAQPINDCLLQQRFGVRKRRSSPVDALLVRALAIPLAGLALLATESAPASAAGAPVAGERAGTHQVMVQVAYPDYWAQVVTNSKHQPQFQAIVANGNEGAYATDGSPTVVVADQSSTLVQPGQALSTAHKVFTSCVIYLGTGQNGTGIDSICVPIRLNDRSTSVALNVIAGWPAHGSQLYVWTHLPAAATVVSYAYKGRDRVWVMPVHGTALMLVPRPAAFDGDYAQWHTAPFPLMKVYDAKGHVIAQQYAPRIAGDSVPRAH